MQNFIVYVIEFDSFSVLSHYKDFSVYRLQLVDILEQPIAYGDMIQKQMNPINNAG